MVISGFIAYFHRIKSGTTTGHSDTTLLHNFCFVFGFKRTQKEQEAPYPSVVEIGEVLDQNILEDVWVVDDQNRTTEIIHPKNYTSWVHIIASSQKK